jgi:hypothetical protein
VTTAFSNTASIAKWSSGSLVARSRRHWKVCPFLVGRSHRARADVAAPALNPVQFSAADAGPPRGAATSVVTPPGQPATAARLEAGRRVLVVTSRPPKPANR